VRVVFPFLWATTQRVAIDTKNAEEKSILVPLTNSLYVKGQLADPDHVLVDVGTGFYVEKVPAVITLPLLTLRFSPSPSKFLAQPHSIPRFHQPSTPASPMIMTTIPRKPPKSSCLFQRERRVEGCGETERDRGENELRKLT
jgi:hypothetical protein